MQIRKESLVNDEYYHIFSRSIAGFVIFNDNFEYDRMFDLIKLYRFSDFNYKYSRFIYFDNDSRSNMIKDLEKNSDLLVQIIAYCIMPTHIHFLLKQISDNGISKYMARILNGYAKYFNTKHKRLGHLWEGRFKNVLVNNNEQLLHLTRYIHLNPTSSNLIKKPEDWAYSSYNEYINKNSKNKICNKEGLFEVTDKDYKQFVMDRKSYQQELSIIKSLLVD